MLEIEKRKVNQHITLKLEGEVDASNSVELDMAIQDLLREKVDKIMIDGSSLEYISSAGLGVFISYLEDFQEKEIKFVIFGLNEKVKNVFHILGLDQLLTIKDEEKKALDVLYGG
jgi:anti-sigma B factor antagonist